MMSAIASERLTAQECAEILIDQGNNNELYQGVAREQLRRLLDDEPDRQKRSEHLRELIGDEKYSQLVPQHFIP